MNIPLPALLKLANFPAEKINTVVDNIDYVTEEEKIKLANLAWYFIAQQYFALLNLQLRHLQEEIKTGKRKYNVNDFEEIKAKLIHDYAKNLESVGTDEAIEVIKKQLEQFKNPQK